MEPTSMPVPQAISQPTFAIVLDRLVRDPSIPMERVEKALELIERQKANEAKAAYWDAMARAQQEMSTISTDCVNPQTKSKYASLAALDKAIRPIYTAHGIAPSFDTRPSDKGDTWIKVVCEVAHIGGYSREFAVEMNADGMGAKGGAVMTRTHATLAAITYARRGLLKMIFNLAEEDNDGTDVGAVISDEQYQELQQLIADTGSNIDRFLRLFSPPIESLADLPAAQFDTAKNILRQRGK